MKRLFALFLAIIPLLLAACSYIGEVPDVPPNTKIKEAEDAVSQPTSSISTQPTESNTETITVATEETPVESVCQATKPAPKNTEIVAESFAAIEVQTEYPTKPTEAIVSGPLANPEPTTPEGLVTVKAPAPNCADIGNLIIAHINEYRSGEGSGYVTKLPGLTEYAEYRSRQLVANFAHDTIDERAAATALHYGQCIAPELYGMIGEPYYTANAREAIAKTTLLVTQSPVSKTVVICCFTYLLDGECPNTFLYCL